MRHPILISLCVAGAFSLSACEQRIDTDEVDRAFQDVNIVDESNLSDIMLTVADPNESVSYFTRATAEKPERLDLQRGLASSLVRAKRNPEAVAAWQSVIKHADSTNDDQVELADAYIRAGKWKEAEATLNAVPPTHETFHRYRLEAMIADANQQWKKADSFYEIAAGMTTRPANVLNNWGYSKLTRGDYADAERLFGEALQNDTGLFTAKNNIVLARAAQRKYTLPVVQMDQIERAQLLHTMGLSAVKQGDIETGKGLLREAVDTHPQHFEAAVRSLRALENG
ncbi:tetratricopeptide repeat protein [Lacimonas salitolerans]|uniref:Tetratricopeptide repeat protein n=1 Tax=Lacimonas salitolerans TaxID=1323750 RepID=A0ABW4ECB9_9RHOB